MAQEAPNKAEGVVTAVVFEAKHPLHEGIEDG